MYNFTNYSNEPKLGANHYADAYISVCVVNVVFSLTAFWGNFLALGAIWKTPTLHQPANVLVSGLALSDLGVGLIIQPLFIALLIYELRLGKYQRELWAIFRSIQAVFLSATILTITSISVDRCLALLLHLRYAAVVTVKKTATLLCFIWITSVLYAMTVFISTPVNRNLSIALISLCIVINISTCSMIYRICRRHRIQIQNQIQVQHGPEAFDMKRYRKSLMTMTVLLILLILCYFPYIFLRIAVNYIYWPPSFRRFMMRCSLFVIYVNSSLNPLVYCWRMGAMRFAMKQFWKSLVW